MGDGVDPDTPSEQAVRHPEPDSNGFIFWLDEPQAWRTTSRWLRLAGWCLHVSGAAVTSIRARIGKREFAIPLEISRPDVIDYFGRSLGNERCGFSRDVRMPRGRRSLTVDAQIHESPWRTVLTATVQGPLFARGGERRRRQERDRAATVQRYHWWYDRPADWSASTRILYVSGWFIDTTGLPVHDNAEFARAPTPQISVLITLYNYAAFIEGCVDAIDRSADLLAMFGPVIMARRSFSPSSSASLGTNFSSTRF